jgi:fumarate reductase subunit D
MPKNDEAKSNSDQSADNHRRAPQTGLWTIFAAAGIFIVVLLLLSIYLPYMSERIKFFTLNALSISVLAAIVVQAYIYRRQWETMERQGKSMHGQLATMNRQADVMANQLEAMAISERAYLSIENLSILPITTNVLTITGDIVNVGRTPAFEITTKTQSAILPIGTTPLLDWSACREDETTALLGAQKAQHLDFVAIQNVTQETVDALNMGVAKVLIDAECRYRDFIGKRQVFTVGFIFDVGSNRKSRAMVRYQNHRTEDNPTPSAKPL